MARARRTSIANHILSDIGVVGLSIIIAIVLIKTHAITQILTSTAELELLGTFVAGMFFTSIFTTAPAIATLGEISLSQSIYTTALVGALGSVVGDLVIFRFIKDRVADDIIEVLRYEGVLRRVQAIVRFRFFRWLTFLLGGIVIASPLPDELGVALLGASKVSVRYFLILSFTFNFLGILAIGHAAHAIAGA